MSNLVSYYPLHTFPVRSTLSSYGYGWNSSRYGLLTIHLNIVKLYCNQTTIPCLSDQAPSTRDQELFDSVLKAWFMLGKLGGYNSNNLQVGMSYALRLLEQ